MILQGYLGEKRAGVIDSSGIAAAHTLGESKPRASELAHVCFHQSLIRSHFSRRAPERRNRRFRRDAGFESGRRSFFRLKRELKFMAGMNRYGQSTIKGDYGPGNNCHYRKIYFLEEGGVFI